MSREDRPADMRVPLTASNAAGFTDPSGRVVTDSQSCPIFANSSDTPICEISGCRSFPVGSDHFGSGKRQQARLLRVEFQPVLLEALKDVEKEIAEFGAPDGVKEDHGQNCPVAFSLLRAPGTA